MGHSSVLSQTIISIFCVKQTCQSRAIKGNSGDFPHFALNTWNKMPSVRIKNNDGFFGIAVEGIIALNKELR